MSPWVNVLLLGVDLLVLCALILWLHWISPRYGLAPLMLCLAAVVTIVHTLGAIGVFVRAPNGWLFLIGSTVLVPATLLGVLVIYVVHGTAATRITIFGILAVSVFALGLHMLQSVHVGLPGGGNLAGVTADSPLLVRSANLTVRSVLALALSLSAVAILYQVTINLWPRTPGWIAAGVSLFGALWTDALVFRIGGSWNGLLGGLSNDLSVKTLSALVMWPLAGWYVSRVASHMPGFAAARDRGALDLLLGTYGRQAEVLSMTQAARKTTEAALRRTQAQLSTVISNAPIVFFALDPDGVFTLSEGKGLEQLGLEPGQVVGESVFRLFPLAGDAVRRALAGETVSAILTVEERVWETTYTPVHDAGGELQGITGVATDLTDRFEAERAMRDSERRFRATFEQAAVGIAHVAMDGQFLRVNQRLADILDYPQDELVGMSFLSVTHPDDVETSRGIPDRLRQSSADRLSTEKRYLTRAGTPVWANLTLSLLRDEGGEPMYFVAVVEDITARKATEEQLRQAQKMEVVGQLTGGVAHDFNNLMTVIMGGLELAREDVLDRAEATQAMDAALEATRRGAALTQRLLAFSRKQTLRPSAVDVRTLLNDMADLLATSLGETVAFETHVEDGLWNLAGDRSQLQNVVLNLALNARDAMPSGGELRVRAYNETLAEDEAETLGAEPGDYVLLEFTDNGVGMHQDTLEHAFEPFFTTKDVGKGSGLGLSMVYGFVNQSGGHVRIESTPGRGTTVKLFMPRADETAVDEADLHEAESRSDPAGNGETILVVEDDVEVRRLVVRLLSRLGYASLEAEDAIEAMSVLESRSDVDLLFTDIVLPKGKTGADLAEEALVRWPDLKVVYTSGYSRDALSSRLERDVDLVEKPFEKSQLAQVLHEVLSR